jgi:two-component system cell cycle response regulator
MKKVLTVDDSKVVRTMVTRALEPYGCQIIEAANGREGVDAARREKPDLILLDVTMPVMDGREALAEIRKDPAIRATPIIMLTAESGRDLVLEIAKLGVKGYIVKPFTKETFDAEVSKVFGPKAQAAADGAGAAAPSNPQCVLVVDDSERVLEMVRTTLAETVQVLTATSGKDAVARYAEGRPGVVVVDLVMPGMDGFETLAKLKEQCAPDSRFVALAVRGDQDAKDRARKAGFAAVIEKPIQADALLALVATSKREAEDASDTFLVEEAGCPVLLMPDAGSKSFGRFHKAASKILRSLVEDGNDRVIVDLSAVTVVNPALVKCVVDIMSQTATLGLKTVVCAPSETVVSALRALSETRGAVYAATRQAARDAVA